MEDNQVPVFDLREHIMICRKSDVACRRLQDVFLSTRIAINRNGKSFKPTNTTDEIKTLQEEIEDVKDKNTVLESLVERNEDIKGTAEESLNRFRSYYKKLHDEYEACKPDLQTERRCNLKLETATQDLEKFMQRMKTNFQQEKCSALLNSCQKTIEEEHNCKLDTLKRELGSTVSNLEHMQSLHSKTCQEISFGEQRMRSVCMKQLQQKLEKVTENIEKEKKEWESLLRSEVEKERAHLEDSLRLEIEMELQESQKNAVAEATRACLEEQQIVDNAAIDKALADAKRQWQKEHGKDIQELRRKRKFDESEIVSEDELSVTSRSCIHSTRDNEKLLNNYIFE